MLLLFIINLPFSCLILDTQYACIEDCGMWLCLYLVRTFYIFMNLYAFAHALYPIGDRASVVRVSGVCIWYEPFFIYMCVCVCEVFVKCGVLLWLELLAIYNRWCSACMCGECLVNWLYHAVIIYEQQESSMNIVNKCTIFESYFPFLSIQYTQYSQESQNHYIDKNIKEEIKFKSSNK